MIKKTIGAAVLAALLGAGGAVLAQTMDGHKVVKYHGKVRTVGGGKIFLDLDDGSTGDWTIARDARIFKGGKKTSLAAVRPGDTTLAMVSQEGTVYELSLGAKSSPKPKASAPAKRKPAFEEGQVKSFEGGKLDVGGKGFSGSWSVDEKTKVFLSGKRSSSAEIRRGQHVRVYRDQGGMHVAKLYIVTPKSAQ